ncbi:uncharacterized protein B0I36DRAFT_17321 [Microdochium trichocladiopsis]|uniref:Uncharacterized protein n=1 Tax=Microdochium trichocladiopsis TaxID=1682393 RepID=A0A9P8YJ41_9PEZI|nr:uncharacterized protein B0I36DRAFT_17321 [Microdochium trichocladiopsis]KAH7040958.1 hypothetical protein B0I36DRAFT_17321 [Microdochium trichocladiopsis]
MAALLRSACSCALSRCAVLQPWADATVPPRALASGRCSCVPSIRDTAHTRETAPLRTAVSSPSLTDPIREHPFPPQQQQQLYRQLPLGSDPRPATTLTSCHLLPA